MTCSKIKSVRGHIWLSIIIHFHIIYFDIKIKEFFVLRSNHPNMEAVILLIFFWYFCFVLLFLLIVYLASPANMTCSAEYENILKGDALDSNFFSLVFGEITNGLVIEFRSVCHAPEWIGFCFFWQLFSIIFGFTISKFIVCRHCWFSPLFYCVA